MKTGFFPMSLQGYQNQLHALLSFDSREWIGSLKVPCLVIAADEDLLADVEDAKQMEEKIFGAEYFCFSKVGHVPMVEKFEEFNKLALEFFAKQ